MNQHANVIAFRKPIEALSREEIVKSMAEHLVAAILHDKLCTASDIDVIRCLLNTPERYQSAIVRNHMDDAVSVAKQILNAMEMSDG
jgi:hypothetical protein